MFRDNIVSIHPDNLEDNTHKSGERLPVNSVFEVSYSWNKEAIPTGGADPVYMMVEWRNGAPAKRLRKIAPKIVSRDLELLLKPEYGVQLKGIYGCRSKETDIGWLLRLGDMYKGESKQILLEFVMGPRVSGKASRMFSLLEHKEVEAKSTCIVTKNGCIFSTPVVWGMLRQPEDPQGGEDDQIK